MAVTATNGANGTQLFAVGSSVARLRYFSGQLLTQRDLQTEQRFHLLLQRLVQREGFGTGTVAGLEVTNVHETTTSPRGIFILPGLAFDPDGRELLLERPVEVDVAVAPLAATPTSFGTPADAQELASDAADRFEASFTELDLDRLVDDLLSCGLLSVEERNAYFTSGDISVVQGHLEKIPDEPAELATGQLLREWIFDQLVGVTYVGIKYREAGTHPSPALLEAACCGDTPCFPSRIQEGLFVVTSSTPFPVPADPYLDLRLCLETQFFSRLDAGTGNPSQIDVRSALCSCLLGAWRGVPPLDGTCKEVDSPALPLAQVCWDRYATEDPTQILSIDNCSLRLLAPGGPALRALIEALTGWATPAALPPRVVAIEPANGAVIAQSETGDGFTLRATVTAELAQSTQPENVWEMLYYPNAPVGPTPFSGVSGPSGHTALPEYIEAGPGQPPGFQVSFSGGSDFGLGTYVWRLTNAAGSELSSNATGARLDGEPNPPAAVPSGDGLLGGSFEARFVVTSG